MVVGSVVVVAYLTELGSNFERCCCCGGLVVVGEVVERVVV